MNRLFTITDARWRAAMMVSVLGLLVGACGLAALTLILAFRSGDQIALERQRAEAISAIEFFGSRLVREIQPQTVWTEAYDKTKLDLDRDWIEQEFSAYLVKTFGYDEVYMAEPDGRIIYSAAGGMERPLVDFEPQAPLIRDAAGTIRQLKFREPTAGNETLVRIAATGGVNRFRGVTQLTSSGGVPAILAVTTIIPSDETDPIVENPRLLIAVYRLDKALAGIGQRFNLSGLHFANGPARAGEVSMPLKSETGVTVGTLVWVPDRPGRRMFLDTALGMLAALTLLLVLAFILASAIRRYVKHLADEKGRAEYLAEHDTLTGLTNRRAFEAKLQQVAADAANGGSPSALFLLDLDLFKELNDTHGHQAGDRALQVIAQRLRTISVKNAMIARVGGDEFAVLVPCGVASDAREIGRWIIDSITEPFVISENVTAYLGTSVGAVLVPLDGKCASDLVRRADVALYDAKKGGRNDIRFFDKAMDERVAREHQVGEALRKAIAACEIDLAFQPVMSADGGRIQGVEALARWTHSELGVVTPPEFIGVAERIGLIGDLGELLLRKACYAAASWPEITIAVNVSPIQFRLGEVPGLVRAVLAETGLAAERLELELTETALFGDEVTTAAQIAELRALGVTIALDDFGTGYSSLSLLRKFDFDRLKIDRSFIRDVETSCQAAAIVRSIISMGRALEVQVTAEGVETAGQQEFLEMAGCDQLQGYYFRRAVPQSEIDQLLAKARKRNAA